MRIGLFTYLTMWLLMSLTSCQQITQKALLGDVVAMVDNTSLTREEVSSVVPSYLLGSDSLNFAQQYIDKWIKRQIKVAEAERIFSSSVHDIEMMVDNYRQALLTQRLDQYFVNSSNQLTIHDEQIKSYYNQHNDNFRLDRHIVKGRILRMPLKYGGESKLKSMMSSNSKDSRLNLISMSEKSTEYELEELTETWIDYDEFLSKLPIVRDSKSKVYMTRQGVQTLKDDDWSYLFEITAYRSAGYVAPLERVEDRIRKILTSDLQAQIIRNREAELYEMARKRNAVREEF